MAVCAYLLVSQLFLHKIYNMYIALGAHALMLLFWIVDLGLVANLARIWSSTTCVYYYAYGAYGCGYGYSYDYGYVKRDEETTVGAYRGALIAGAVFAAIEFAGWVASAVVLIMHMNKHRSNTAATHVQQPPPQYADTTVNSHNNQAVPMEKYNQAAAPQQQYQQQPYSAAPTPQPTYAQPGQGQYTQQPEPATYQHEPVNRTNTVSPVSHAGGYGNASELSTPQHTDNYNPNVSELSTQHNTGHYDPNVSELSTNR
jgi:hypothetical protein